MDPHTQRAEAERWLGIAAKLLTARDFIGSKTFAIRAREADPQNSVSDQILAVVDTVLAGEKRVNSNQQPDWYGVLQLPRLIRDGDLIADHYRRLLLCLNPERNRFPFSDYALQLVMDAWSVLSDPNKKWLFDSELALYLQQQQQQTEGGAAGASVQQTVQVQTHQQQDMQQATTGAALSSVAGPGGGAAAAAAGGGELNTFQFFQQQPQQQQQQMWQQPQQMQSQLQQQQIDQRGFISLQSQPQQQMGPQWQMRDPVAVKGGGGGGGGESNKGILNGIGGLNRGGTNTGTPMTPVVRGMPQAAPPPPPPQQPVSTARVAPTMNVGGGGGGGGGGGNATATSFNEINSNINNGRINNDKINDYNNDGNNLNGVASDTINDDVNDDDDVVEEVDCFWTACPYCLYIFEYQKIYQDCTLRCQNCKRGFHALQIPNPPPISGVRKGGGGKEDKDKEKGNSFCCWGFYPLGFSMTAWKKQNQIGNLNGSSNWVPFSPMFNCPVKDGGGSFEWFDNAGGNAFVGPKDSVKQKTSWVYIDDDEAFDDVSESSDLDSSDGDWRNTKQTKNKSKSKKRRRGRPKKDNGIKTETLDVPRGGGVSVGGEDMDDESDAHEVVFSLAAGDRPDARKTIPAGLARKLTRRSVKDVGRLDLNVEFNNEGEDHAPTVSAVNGEEDGIENIAFFDGLDEFLSTLPILNVAGDEKAKPS